MFKALRLESFGRLIRTVDGIREAIMKYLPDGFEPCALEKKYGRPKDMCQECVKNDFRGFITWEELDVYGYGTPYSYKCKHYPCSKYPEALEERKRKILETSGIPEEYRGKTIREYKAFDKKIMAIRTKVADFAYACDKPNFKNWLYLAGQSGSGKTHLACAVGTNLIRLGRTVKMYFWPELMREVKNFDYKNFEQAKYVDVLILDDLYKGNPTSEEMKRTFELIDYRRSNGLQTIITTERGNREMNELDSALIGRIVEACDGNWAFIPKSDSANHRISDFLNV